MRKNEKRYLWVGVVVGGVVADVDDKSGVSKSSGREYKLVSARIGEIQVTAFGSIAEALLRRDGQSVPSLLVALVDNDGYVGLDLLAFVG